MTVKQGAAKTEETANLPSTDLYAGFSAEERAELLGVTGQINSLRGDKVPNLKVNYCDTPDKEGNTIKKGNFVLGQNSSETEVEVEVTDEDGTRTETEPRVEYIGIDLGKSPKITVLTYGQQYSSYTDDPKQRCQSPLILDSFEVPVGHLMKKECRSKSDQCPRRADGAKPKCSCQWVVFCVATDTEGKAHNCVMYVKGLSFMPFSDYLKSAGTNPVCFFPTRLTNKMEKQGQVPYWITTPELLLTQPYPELERRANFNLAKEAKLGAQEFKEQQAAKSRQKSLGSRGGGGERQIGKKNDDVVDVEFD